jgi:ferrochelatase
VSGGRLAVVLFQLGGPDSPGAVEPFLYNLFCDPDIIDFPGAFLARKPLARFISRRRSPKVAAHYHEIGGKSPILDLTLAQAAALEDRLRPGMDCRVFTAMRYWKPFTADVVREVRAGGFDKIFLLPLYPHYSKATTLSSMKEWRRSASGGGLDGVPESTVCCFFNHPLYVRALAGRINEGLARMKDIPPGEIDILFSAHGVPVSLIRSGDPYRLQIVETVRLVMAEGGWRSPHTLCFQSKVGPAEWLRPGLNETVERLAAGGRKNLLVVPVSFVTDHIETLHEIDIETRELAEGLGIERFEMTAGLNSDPLFISCLADLVQKGVAGTPHGLPTCRGICGDTDGPSAPGTAPAPSLCPHWSSPSPLSR